MLLSTPPVHGNYRFQENADFEIGAFPPPKKDADGKCYISDHTDIGMGMNPNSKNKEAAMKFPGLGKLT